MSQCKSVTVSLSPTLVIVGLSLGAGVVGDSLVLEGEDAVVALGRLAL